MISTLLKTLLGTSFQVENKIAPIINSQLVAFHPFPSAEFRYWPMQNWQELGRLVLANNHVPMILCSKAEKKEAEYYFKHENSIPVKSCSSIEELIAEIKKIDLLVGVDSFLIHLAAALGKKTISITAGHLPHWWSPPENIALGQSGGCLQYPCANQPSCLGSINESECIKSIEPRQVLQAIEAAFSYSSAA